MGVTTNQSKIKDRLIGAVACVVVLLVLVEATTRALFAVGSVFSAAWLGETTTLRNDSSGLAIAVCLFGLVDRQMR